MATKLKKTSKATKTTKTSKTSKKPTRKNGSGVSQKDIANAQKLLDYYHQNKETSGDAYSKIVREHQEYVRRLNNMYENKKEMYAQQYNDYEKLIKQGKMVNIPLRQRFNPFSSQARRLSELNRLQYSNVKRGGETKKKTTKKTSKKLQNTKLPKL